MMTSHESGAFHGTGALHRTSAFHRTGAGRFAPSPSGDLHVGNLRTALLAWLFARSTGRSFIVRMEDLDRVRPGADVRQLADLAAIGLDWDGPVVHQSRRTARYAEAIDRLTAQGLTYECFCTRREIREAASAPHLERPHPGTPHRDAYRRGQTTADASYPGTCRDLRPSQVAERRTAGRPGALRLRSGVDRWTVQDELFGPVTGTVDDVVLRRNDGVAAYNLAVVVDDAAQGVDQIVRADDLLTSAPRQAYLGSLLGLPAATYAHVPLAVNGSGQRLAKRDGAVTLADLSALGRSAHGVISSIAASLDLAEPGERVLPADLLARFDPARLPRAHWVVGSAELVEGW